MIKTIVLDMDGTLINSNDVISKRTKDVLINAQKGIRIILASGRATHRMIPFAEELQMDKYNGYLVYVNGTGIYNMQTKVNKRFHELSIEDQTEIFHFFKDRNIELLSLRDEDVFAFIPSNIYIDKLEEARQLGLKERTPLVSDGHKSIGRLKENGYIHINMVVDEDSYLLPSNKMAIFGTEKEVIDLVDEAASFFENKYWVGRTMSCWGEIMPFGVNKAETLKHLFTDLDIDASQAIAFGDGENDIEMLKMCGTGVAMGNSLDTVKSQTDKICRSNDEDGIAIILEELLLK